MIGCFGLTEPSHGSDPSGMLTTATEATDGSGGFGMSLHFIALSASH